MGLVVRATCRTRRTEKKDSAVALIDRAQLEAVLMVFQNKIQTN